MLTSRDDNELLTALQEGLYEQPLWSTFTERLRQRTRADRATIVFRPPGDDVRAVELSAAPAHSPEIVAALENRHHSPDPIFGLEMREGRTYALNELLQPDKEEHRVFIEEVLDPLQVKYMRLIRVTEPGGVSATLSISRRKGDFTAADGALLSRLADHFRLALRHFVVMERQRHHSDIASELLRRLDFGWISLDDQGRVVEASDEAKLYLRLDHGLRVSRGGRLYATNPSVDRRFSTAVRDLAKEDAKRPRAINIGRDPWVDLLLMPSPERTSQASSANQRRARIIAYLQGDNRSTEDRHEQIAELFGLTPSEARLAWALSRGLTIAEAAESLGLTVETARNYSKKIYAKMGARGQTDLIRFILTSVLALA